MLRVTNTHTPYKELPHRVIQYAVCTDYEHISRYKSLRQVVHSPEEPDERFVALETVNSFSSSASVIYYDVPAYLENRLDLIAQKFLGSASYAWIIAYFNSIEDGFTVREGQRLKIPTSVSSLFAKGELLASVNPMALNLGTE